MSYEKLLHLFTLYQFTFFSSWDELEHWKL